MTDYAGAANALGVPEAILRRSAEARAKASGITVDELLAAWAGGEAPPAAAPAEPEPDSEGEPAPEPAATTPAAAPATEVVAAPPPVEPPTAPGPVAPPILVGVAQSLGGVLAGAIGILVLSVLLAFVVPSLPQPGTGVRSSLHPFSSSALAGKEIYLEAGCASCHTQLIRNVVADARLGPVTLSDTNLVIGYRRAGPDLAAIGARTDDTAALAALLSGAGNHPTLSGLDQQSLSDLLTYLREST